ncbi:MAG: hypothetical protein AW11_03759 [Candidatus Accumulibacter regalis]|jgi:hypothetical protein|uniref:Cytoplasmic protein n=1 Tax=Accumulibacter regalis TaxID=522306 RepID=A0A011R0K1_ACCRE|nr:DUF1788 domain-containing protein [Accumulibacter sp.]EXI84704.1 MAG: hypothetical protein AW11_03759 [Candidatus Accumulibacter regalis]HRE72528.1 DUF1788 domain-containing protein [Accumulibacter sp.]
MSQKLDERLNQILPRLTSPDVLANKGSGGEIGFWIFDYPPEDEMAVRAFLQGSVLPALARHQPAIRATAINLFDLVIGLLEERKLLDKVIEMQRTQGDAKTLEELRGVLKEDKLAKRLVTKNDIAGLDLLILWNVGAVYPMLRTHTLLSALHAQMQDKPLVMFYPGKYDGYSLRLFSRLKDDHYYRAFRLVS